MNTFGKITTVAAFGILTLGSAVAGAEGSRAFLPHIGQATSHVAAVTAGIGTLSVELGNIVAQVGTVTAEIGALIGNELTREFQKRSKAPRVVTSRSSAPSVEVTELIDSVVVVATRLPPARSDEQGVIRTAQASY